MMASAKERPGVLRVRFRTIRWLWIVLCLLLFIGFGFLPPVGETKGDGSYWARISAFVKGDYFVSTHVYITTLVLHTVLLAFPAALFGWVIQAALVVICECKANKLGSSD
jgi:hypothetical protein